ncbi:helix-turn-helix domain-containing protein [Alkalicella caledoniensis]|nr:LuxR C-terminal-related transcriptional regulator [Alkalicella caledoniensis]
MNLLIIVHNSFDSINNEIIIYLKNKQKVQVVDVDNSNFKSILENYKGVKIWASNCSNFLGDIWEDILQDKSSSLVLTENNSVLKTDKFIAQGVNFIVLPPNQCLYLNTKNHKVLRAAVEILTWSVDKMKIKERSLVALSRKENEVVNLLLQGLDDREIAKQLFISDKTVRNHISNILQKICLRNRTQLVLWALQEMGEIEQLS